MSQILIVEPDFEVNEYSLGFDFVTLMSTRCYFDVRKSCDFVSALKVLRDESPVIGVLKVFIELAWCVAKCGVTNNRPLAEKSPQKNLSQHLWKVQNV